MTTLLDRLRRVLSDLDDPALLIEASDADYRYTHDSAGVAGQPLAVLRPASPKAVEQVMITANRLGLPLVVQGGMTGMIGSCVPQPGEVVLTLERLNRIEEIDVISQTITVQAGVKLQEVQEAAEAHGLFFPVDIGSKGSCQVGGIISTNAGGNRVLRYGMTRQSVLGLEVVLPDGQVISNLSKTFKDNTGYDLKQLFIGSEGTLGVVTRAVLALQPLPRSRQTAMVSVRDFDEVLQLLRYCRQALGPRLTSFEVMWRDYYDLVTGKLAIGRKVFEKPGGNIVLVEAMGQDPVTDDELFSRTLEQVMGDFAGADAAMATSLADAKAFWAIREASGEGVRAASPCIVFDVGLPLHAIGRWVPDIREQLARLGVKSTQTYGHIGDGNVHLIAALESDDAAAKAHISDIVHESVARCGGTISAEQGIGIHKKKYLVLSRSEEEISLMRKLKQVLDPNGLLNRGRIFDVPPGDVSPRAEF